MSAAPGPWKLRLGKGMEHDYIITDAAGHLVTGFSHYKSLPKLTKKQCKANARLISAAPELLTWLRWSLKYLPDDVKQSGQYRMAQAVAKATEGAA